MANLDTNSNLAVEKVTEKRAPYGGVLDVAVE